MSSIARELFDEICEESPVKSSKHSTQESFKRLNPASSSRYNGRPTRSIVVEKKRVINKVVPSDSISKSRVINKFKSKETLKKTFVDLGTNTIITGPLRSNNTCVTMVQKRDPKNVCKCNTKGLKCKDTKEIQTFGIKNYTALDKACTQCVETVNCGTQFFERLGGRVSKEPMSDKIRTILRSTNTQTTWSPSKQDVSKENESKTEFAPNKSSMYNYMGARRWALSHYPTRGPDF